MKHMRTETACFAGLAGQKHLKLKRKKKLTKLRPLKQYYVPTKNCVRACLYSTEPG